MRYCCLTLLLLFCLSVRLPAHQPHIVTSFPVIIHEPEVSKAYYAQLTGQPQEYLLDSSRPFHLYVQLTVPEIAGANRNIAVDIIRDRRIFYGAGQQYKWESFYEPFGGDRYWAGPEYDQQQAPAGHYRIIVYAMDSRPAKYALATGTIESFPPREIVRTLGTLPAIKRFMGKSALTAYFNLFGLFLLIPLLLLIVIIVLIIRWRRRRRRMK